MIKRKLFVIIFLIWTSACIGQQAKNARTNRPLNIECSTPHNPIIMLMPVNQTICPGSTVTFTASAPIRDNYYWQMSKDSGITWIDTAVNAIFPLSNYVDSLTITNVSPQMNGYQFRCIFLGACSGFSRTTAATLTVKATPIQIDFQPISISFCNRTAADFQVKASGSSLSYQWQQKSNGENIFTDIPGKKAALLHFDSVSLSMNGTQYRCYVSSDCAAAVISNQCVLTVIDNSTTITSQPANQVVCNGDTSFFSIAVTGTNVRLQWQKWQTSGGYYADINGANLPTLAIPFPASDYYYRCKIESSCNTLFSNSVGSRYIAPPAFGVAQEKYVCSGEEIYFSSIPYYGGNELNFQWQISADSGITYANIPGETSDYIYLHATQANNGSRFRCHTTSACFDGYSNVNKLYNVYIPTTITRQPTDKVVCNGLPTTLSIVVTGSIASFQWQESSDGGISFSPSVTNGYDLTTPIMQLYNVPLSQNNYQYQCKIISYCGDTLYSNTALLKVFTKPSLGHDTLIAVSCDTCTTDITHIFDTTAFAGLLWNTTHPSSVSMGKYYLKVFNNAGCNDSAFIYVNVHIVDTIEACKGAAVNITSAITGSTYQWEWDSYGNYSDIPEYLSAMENEAITGTRTAVLNMRGVDVAGRHIRCRINNTLYSHVIFVKQVAYWNGNISNAWEEPLNWSCGVIPDYNTEVYILKDSPHNPQINAEAACKKIVIANSGTLTVKEGVHLDIY